MFVPETTNHSIFDTEIAKQLCSCIRCGFTFLFYEGYGYFRATVIVDWSLVSAAFVEKKYATATRK